MRVHRGTALVAGAAILALGATACGGSSSGGGTGGSGNSGSGSIIWGEPTDFPANLMPLIAAGNSTATANLEVRVLDGPFRVSPSISFVPDPMQGTATSSVVNGQQVVDLKINPKAVWDDGKPITAADYAFTWQAQKSSDPKNGGCASLLGTTGFDQIEKADQVSDKEVKFTFIKGKPFADWKSLFSGSNALILSKHVFDQGSPKANCAYITKGWPTKAGIPAGASNGPWLIKSANVDTQKKTIVEVPNPKYWGPKPKLARIIYQTIGSESDTNVKALQNQEVNVIYPQPQLDLIANLKKLQGVKTEVNFGVAFEHLDFNTADPLLKIANVRKAIALAIDRKKLVAATVGQFSPKAQVLGNRLVLNTQTGYEDHSGEYATQNIAKAKQLIEAAGGTLGSDGIYRIGGKQLSFRVSTTTDNSLRADTVQTIAAQVKAAGIKMTLFQNPDIFEGKEKPNSLEAEGFQIALFAWVGSPAISSNKSIYYTKSKGGGQNYSQGSTDQIDAALSQMSNALSTTAELAAANKADSLLWQQMYTLPLYQKPTLLAFSDNISGLADNSTQAGPLWNSDGISVK